MLVVETTWLSSSDPDSSKAALIRKPLLLPVIAPTPARSGSGSFQLSCVSLVDTSIVSEASGV